MEKILVIGSINMDFAVRVKERPKGGETVLAERMALIPGGKGANQAYACAALGADTAMLGCVGDDSYGDRLISSLAASGADTNRIVRLPGVSTGIALISIDSRGENSITVVPGANGLVGRSHIDENLDAIRECGVVVLQMEIPTDTVVYAAKRAHQLGKRVILDPAPAPDPFPEEVLACLDVIKPNEHELALIAGLPDEAASIRPGAEKLLALGAKNVVVTLGREGAYVCAADGTRKLLPVADVPVVDTTAAGDTFTAAMALRLAQGHSLCDAVAYANRVATIVVQREGAQSSIPLQSELRQLLGE